MPGKTISESLVLIPSNFVSRFEGQLVPLLQARGVFPKEGGDVAAWLERWLESPTGFFWGAISRQPEAGGTYRVYPRRSKPLEGKGFQTWLRIGDCSAKVVSDGPLTRMVGVRVTGVSHNRAEVELVDEPPELDSPYATEFRVFHTADGVTGLLAAFAGTNAMQLVNVWPNEQMPIGVLGQLPETISVRKDRFPLHPVLWGAGAEAVSNAHRLCCECDNCHGERKVECEKCAGSGRLVCHRCGGSGHVDCKKCEGTGSFTLPARDVTCKKCGGSGDYYRNGDYVGECRLCGGSGSLHFDAHDVECSACNGSGKWDCKGCSGTGSITCFSCQGSGEFECWVCKGTGSLRVQVDAKTGRFYRKHKDEVTWLDASDVFLLDPSGSGRTPLVGRWPDIQRAAERQAREEETRRIRSDRIVRDGKTIDGCLDRVLALSPAVVKPFEVRNPVPVPGRKAKGRVFYEFDARGDSPWLFKKGGKGSDPAAEPDDRNESAEPFRPGTHVSFDGVSVPEGKPIVYEGSDGTGRKLVFSFPFEVDGRSLEDRRISVKADAIPPPEKREKERLGFWLENRSAPVFRGLVDGVEDARANIRSFLNESISKFPVQVDAIRQGLSDSPVLLLKGPPGTGKTTVIVELIRQAVRQGKRVLLTSQTHQAVDNVLERLHRFRESGEDRIVRMAVYSASEAKLSDLGRRYMAGEQEEECREIRERAESVLAKLEVDCARNRTIRDLLSEGRETASAIRKRRERRDADLHDAEAKRDNDLAKIAQRHDAEMSKENASFEEFRKENGKRQRSARRSIDAKDRKIRDLESDRDWYDRQAKGRSKKSGFARNTRVGRFLRSATDRTLRGIDRVVGTHLDPEKARQAWHATNESLSRVWMDKRSFEARLASEEEEFRKTESVHKAACSAIEERKESELKTRRTACEESLAAIRGDSDADTAPLYEVQKGRISGLVENGANDEASKLSSESEAGDWGEDVPRFDREFRDLDRRRAFALDWATELKASPRALARFLNAQTNVFFATCVGMGSWRALSDGTYERRDSAAGGAGRTVFDLTIVDEAGHATFAETIVPICSAKKVVLIGDDRQLPPMLGEELDCRENMDVRCPSCAVGADGRQCWFEYSMFQYLWENDEAFHLPRLMLDTQFRMHPDIADFISETFYGGRIRNGVSAEDRKFSFGAFRSAVCLLSTSKQGNRFEQWVGTSCSNPLEAEYVRGVVEELLAAEEAGSVEGGPDKALSLAVITPYAAQESLLRRELSSCFRNTDRIAFSAEDIASVDRFQGDERDIVIASFVRSPNTGSGRKTPKLTFVHDLKRMNVAFSRARRMLILVGDIEALETAKGNERGRAAFARFREHVDKRGRQILVWERKAR